MFGGAFRHMVRFGLTQLAIGVVLAQSGLTLRVVSEDIAPGGWAQIKVFADSPALIAKATLSMDLDPLVFGPIESIATFSASGDAMGLGTVNGTHVEASLLSASGGIGQLGGVPVFVVRAPVLANARESGFVSLSLPQDPQIGRWVNDPYPVGAWADPGGKAYTVTLLSATMRARSTIAIRSVAPGWGFQAAGTILQIDGTGFNESTRIVADGLAFSAMKFVSPTRMEATLASAAELTGIPFRLTQANVSSTYFAQPQSILSPPGTDSSFITGRHVILPITDRTKSTFFQRGGGSKAGIFANPNAQSIELEVADTSGSVPVGNRHYTLSPGAALSLKLPGVIDPNSMVTSQAPFRALEYYENISTFGVQAAETDTRPVLASIVNGASNRIGDVAPGEIITLRGIRVGPATTGLTLDGSGRIQSSVGTDTQVLINDMPAPILYASPTQWNVVVPYEVAGRMTADIRVQINGVGTKTWTLPIAAAAPGIFTIGSTGGGRGAVLNQDNSVNSVDNYAAAGTVVQIFATRGGQSFPDSVTGSVTASTGGGTTRVPVKAFFSGIEAAVVFAGPAPGFASGALQVNAVVPRFGQAVQVMTMPLSLEINGVRSAPVDITIR